MTEDLLDDLVVIDKRDQFHLSAAMAAVPATSSTGCAGGGTRTRRSRPRPWPLRRRARPRALARSAPCPVGVPAVVTDHLEAFVGDVLRDGRHELLGQEDFEIALGLGVHARAVD